MSERQMPNQEREKMREICKEIANAAQIEVGGKYGTGYEVCPEDNNSEIRCLPYHNMQHSWRVHDAALLLARRHGLDEYDQAMTGMIAAAHDVVHDGSEDDEAASAEWLIERMKNSGFGREDQEIARLAILGTTPILDTQGNLMSQQFTLTYFPSQRAGEIALCVAAADMEAIFAHYGPCVSHDLLRERLGMTGYKFPDNLDGVLAFQYQQLELLQSYRLPYPELEEIFGGKRTQNFNYQLQLLRDIEAGAVTNWAEILQKDNDYAARQAVL